MPSDFFEQMDRAGILVNAGYQCCDAWQLQQSHLTSPADFKIMRLSALTIGQNLRNHPSVFSFQWSDSPPTRQAGGHLAGRFHQADFTDPIISSAEYNRSPKLGVSGEKEGPYDWVPPSYWYDTRHYDKNDSTQTNAGGAWGYDSEESAGNTIPTLDSLRRFMSATELSNLWRNPQVQPVPPQLRAALRARLQLRHAVPLRHRAARQVRRLVRPGPVRRGGPGPGLREHQGAVRGVHRPRAQQATAVHRHDLLADEQGLAEPAVEPLRQRRRPGGQLFRRAGGEPSAARPVRAGQRHRHGGQPGRHAQAGLSVRGHGLQPHREGALRPHRRAT